MKQAYADVLNMVTVLTPSLFTRTLARAITPTKIGVTEITRWQWIHPLFLQYDHHEWTGDCMKRNWKFPSRWRDIQPDLSCPKGTS